MKRIILLLLPAVLFAGSCKEINKAVEDAKKGSPGIPKDNYIVLLDLSDRILYNNQQQIAKDLTDLKIIYAIFKSRLESKDPTHLYYNASDKLKILIAPQKTSPQKLYEIAGNLRIDLSSELPDAKAKAVSETQQIFDNNLPTLYKEAVTSTNPADYSGADIWKYFNEDLENDLEKNGKNTLFIITDGYLNFERVEGRPMQQNRFTSCSQIINGLRKYPDWDTKFDSADFGLLSVGKKFPELRVVLLEINPNQQWNGEFHLLTKIWSKWFNEMGITSCSFIKNYSVNEVKESLEKCMQTKLTEKFQLLEFPPVIKAQDSSLSSKQTLSLSVH